MSRIDMLSVDRPARHGDRQPDQGIFQLIHEVYKIVHETIDGALTWEQLTSPELNYSIVRPLTKKLSKHNDGSMIYVLMVNRIRFLQVVEHDLAFQALNSTRANLCELLSMKLLRTFSESELESVSILTRPYSPFSGAPSEVWDSMSDDEKEDVEEEIGNALEMAIVSSSKHFLATPLAQRVIDAIHSGTIVYTSRSSRSIINDTYVSSNRKQRIADNQRRYSAVSTTPSGRSVHVTDGDGVYVYDAREAGWLDHTRLRVPKWRTMIEFINFAILTALFIWNLTASRSEKHFDHIHLPEILFVIYCLGFSLDELATTNENGWTIYFANTWNAFDIAFIGLFFVYLVLRVVGLATKQEDTSALAFDLLSIGASILLPRLCFFFIKDNVLIISLKAMISDFIGFMAMAAVCFSGILFTLWTLGKETWTIRRIAWLMLQIWFGSSYLGFSEADSFHPTLGPIIMVVYAALSNTLLVTILISILSNRFAVINSNAREEHMFQKAIHTVEGVKADYIFSYPIPLNMIALVVITPLSWILDAHALHQVNVFAIRLVYLPVLFAISAYERWRQRPTGRGIQLSRGTSKKASTRTTSGGTMFESFLGASTQSTIRAVFQHGADILQLEDSALETPGGRTDEEHGTETLSRTKRQATSKASPLGKMMTTRVNLPSTQLDEEDARPASSEKVLEIADLRAEIKRIRQGMERMEELLSKATS